MLWCIAIILVPDKSRGVFQGHPQLHTDFETSLRYMRCCLKTSNAPPQSKKIENSAENDWEFYSSIYSHPSSWYLADTPPRFSTNEKGSIPYRFYHTDLSNITLRNKDLVPLSMAF